jgi:voltage-gated potassium channel
MSQTGATTRHVTEKNNFTFLAAALVVLLLGLALSHEFGMVLGQIVVEAGLIAALGVGVWSMRGEHRLRTTRLGLLAAVILFAAVQIWVKQAGFDLAWLGIVVVYLVLTTWSAMRLVLFSGPVDWNKIVGSYCVYLLLGIIWALLYMMLAEFRPGSIQGLATDTLFESFPKCLYFSFITLTTVGYGDLTPTGPLAHFLALMEAVTGQFYLAVLVASLVGSALSNRRAA